MKKRAFMLVGILLISIVMSACSSNSKSTTNENETTIIQAEYPVYDTAEEIVDASDLVFSGTVTEINYESLNVKSETGADSETGLVEATEIPYTIFDISIEKVYKGNVESSSISIKRPGGKIDGQFFVVEGASTIEVREVFNISKVGMVAGAMVKTGKVKRTDKARLIRDGIVIFTGSINALKRFKDDVKEVGTNFECGISLTNCNDLKVGDVIETYEEVEVKQTL